MTRKKPQSNDGLGPSKRTSAGLRDALFDELDQLRNGHTNPARANATARLAGEIISTVQMELEVQRHVSKIPAGVERAADALMKPIPLGHDQ